MKHLKKLISPIAVIIAAALLRLVPHLPNFAPVGAMALFGGVYLNKKYAVITILLTLLISDYLLLYINPFSSVPINFSKLYSPIDLIHSTTIFVYGSFLLNVFIGKWIANHKSFGIVITGSLLASIQFFLITNFGVWVTGMYDRGIEGLIQSYIMGLPFFRYTLLGDLFYTIMLFRVYELALRLTRNRILGTTI